MAVGSIKMEGGGGIEIRGKTFKSLPSYAEIVKFRLIFNTFDINF